MPLLMRGLDKVGKSQNELSKSIPRVSENPDNILSFPEREKPEILTILSNTVR
jgi:hypothetical protein